MPAKKLRKVKIKSKQKSFKGRLVSQIRERMLIITMFIAVFGMIGLVYLFRSYANPRIYCPLDKINFSSWTPGSSDKWQAPGRNHWGVDINEWNSGNTGGAATGAPIRASIDGRIKTSTSASDAGNYIELVGSAGHPMFRYLHMTRRNVSAGQYVRAGDVIGYVGSTGARTVHLHFDYRVAASNTKNASNAPDPLPLLRNCYRGSNTSKPVSNQPKPLCRDRYLYRGVQGENTCVYHLQGALNAHGYSPGELDGVFGQKTEDALKRFQASPDRGGWTPQKPALDPDGATDAATSAHLCWNGITGPYKVNVSQGGYCNLRP